MPPIRKVIINAGLTLLQKEINICPSRTEKTFLPCILIALFFLMLLHSSETMAGALNGLNLWLFTVVPSLLPYMMISAFLTESRKIMHFIIMSARVQRNGAENDIVTNKSVIIRQSILLF